MEPVHLCRTIPRPPPGYLTAIPLSYPRGALQRAAVIIVLVATPLLLVVAWLLHDGPPAVLGQADLAQVVQALLSLPGTIVIHELLHALVYRCLGYRVSFGVSAALMAAYAAAFGQWQRRDHNILVALAPVLILTPLAIVCMALPQPALQRLGFWVALFNTAGSVGDFYLAWRLLRLPHGSLLYDADPQHMYIVMPG